VYFGPTFWGKEGCRESSRVPSKRELQNSLIGEYHAFADNTQLYLHCSRDDMPSTALQLERCLTDVGHWMSANRLKLNADKTELLWAGMPDQGSVALPWATVVPSYSSFLPKMSKVLGVTLSSDLTMDKHDPTLSQPDFIGCGNFDVFGGHWTRSRLQPSYTPSSRPASITVTYCWLGHRRLQLTSYTASFECCSTSSQWYEEV